MLKDRAKRHQEIFNFLSSTFNSSIKRDLRFTATGSSGLGFWLSMSILKRLKPGFLDHKDVSAGPYKHHFDFLRIWKRAILVTATVALVPLIIWALSGYRLTMETIESELVFIRSGGDIFVIQKTGF